MSEVCWRSLLSVDSSFGADWKEVKNSLAVAHQNCVKMAG